MLAIAAVGTEVRKRDLSFAHCRKNGADWAYIKNDWCVTKWGGRGSACNGACPDSNRRYYTFEIGDNVGLCKFKAWCEKDGDGHQAMYKSCNYKPGLPYNCDEDDEYDC